MDIKSNTYVGDIQALRAIAITLVFLQHFTQWILGWPPFVALTANLGLWAGVDLFFAISGYLIVTKLLSTPAGVPGRVAFGDFWSRRFWRLMPAALFWCLAASIVLLAVPGIRGASPLQVLASGAVGLFGISNLYWSACDADMLWHSVCASSYGVHTINWSLSLEEQFYLIASVLILTRRTRLFLVLLWLACFADLFTQWDGWAFGWSLRPYSLAAGATLALLFKHYPGFQSIRVARSDRLALFAFFLISIPALGALYRPEPTLLIGIVTGLTVWLATMDGCISKGLLGRILVWIGERSYSLYLCHYTILIVMRFLFSNLFPGINFQDATVTFGLLFLCYALSLFVSNISFKYIENRFRFRVQTRIT